MPTRIPSDSEPGCASQFGGCGCLAAVVGIVLVWFVPPVGLVLLGVGIPLTVVGVILSPAAPASSRRRADGRSQPRHPKTGQFVKSGASVDIEGSPDFERAERLARKVCECRYCFGRVPGVEIPKIADGHDFDVPQPRWIGSRYFTSHPRVLVLMMNPGAGEGSKRHEENLRYLQLLRDFRDGQVGLADLFAFQKQDMKYWGGRRSFAAFYTTDRGLALEDIALLNVAWCPTRGDKYPKQMLNTCWDRNTRDFLRFLNPGVVIFAGAAASAFEKQVKAAVPREETINCLHHANRKSADENRADAEAVETFLAKFSKK